MPRLQWSGVQCVSSSLQQMHRLQRSGVQGVLSQAGFSYLANLLAPGLGGKNVWRTPPARSLFEDNRSTYPTQKKLSRNKTNLKKFLYLFLHEQLDV